MKTSLKFPQRQNAICATIDIVVKPHFKLHAEDISLFIQDIEKSSKDKY